MFTYLPFFLSKSATPTTRSEEEIREALQDALRHYEAPGLLPPDSRVDPRLPQREPGSLFSIRSLWKLGWFVAAKSTEVLQDVISHQVYGPKRPTWGIEMTILSSFMRNLAQHSELTNIVVLRAVMAIGGLVPTPSSAIVTPVTISVRRRELTGILKEFDAQEDGRRELHGEWVVGREVWTKMQYEWKDGRRRTSERVILYLHGGAYYVFSAATHRLITIRMSKACGVRVFAINYRLAPETRFPGALHDAVLAYLRLTEELHIPAQNIIVAGDSAGGGLAVALMMYLRDEGLPLPGGAILLSPWVDLTMSCASWDTNAEFDVCPMPSPGDHMNPVYCYLGMEGLQKGLATHPYASPLFGNFRGLPPMLVQCGEAEVLRDECTLLAHKATRSHVKVIHEVYQDAVHVFQTFPFLAVAQKAYESMCSFVHRSLPHEETHLPSADFSDVETSSMVDVDEEIRDDSRRVSVNSVGDEDNGKSDPKLEESPEDTSEEDLTPHASPQILPMDELLDQRGEPEDLPIDLSSRPPTPSPPQSALPRSKSATTLHMPGSKTPPITNHRRHKRTSTTFASLTGFTPARPPASVDSADLSVRQWAFTMCSRPTSPTFSKKASASASVVGDDDDYFAYAQSTSSPVPVTPAPAVRKNRSRSGTVSTVMGGADEVNGATEVLERMCREYEVDGPANISVWCRRVEP